MKKILYLTGFLALTIACTNSLFGQSKIDSVQFQSDTQVEVRRSLILENDSKNENIRISVNENIKLLDLMVYAQVSEGRLSIEIYSPSGKKEWNITVGNQTNSNKNEQVYGTIRKTLHEPQTGDWIVKLIPEKTTASIDIRTKSSEK